MADMNTSASSYFSSDTSGVQHHSFSDGDSSAIVIKNGFKENLAKKNKAELKKLKKAAERKRKNKIAMDDFYSKMTEFKTWLLEEKNKNYEGLKPVKARELFKKFIKKWNKRKLPRKYYRGIDRPPSNSLSSDAQSTWSLVFPTTPHVPDLDSPCLPPGHDDDVGFSTFGKHKGLQIAKFLAADKTAKRPPSCVEGHIYDEPLSPPLEGTDETPTGVTNGYTSVYATAEDLKQNPLGASFEGGEDSKSNPCKRPVMELYAIPKRKKKNDKTTDSNPSLCGSALQQNNSVGCYEKILPGGSTFKTPMNPRNPPQSLQDLTPQEIKKLIMGKDTGNTQRETKKRPPLQGGDTLYQIMPKDQDYVYMKVLQTNSPTFL